MKTFETAYKKWLEEIASKKTASLATVNGLTKILFEMKNVYPVAKLHDCQDAVSDDPQITLDYSTIGVI